MIAWKLGMILAIAFLAAFLASQHLKVEGIKEQEAKEKKLEDIIYEKLKNEGTVILHGPPIWEIYLKKVEGRKLIDIQIMRRTKEQQNYDFIARAKEGSLKVDLKERQLVVDLRHCCVMGEEDELEARVVRINCPDLGRLSERPADQPKDRR
jgi:hypothetical protein